MQKLYGIYGCSGLGRETLPLLRKPLVADCGSPDEYKIVFIDDAPENRETNGIPVMSLDNFMDSPAEERYAAFAIGNSPARRLVMEKCLARGIRPLHVQAPNVVVHDNVEIGEGALLCPFVTLTSDIRIGKGFQANIYSYVAHDCVIGDYVTFAPRVNCNGNVHIEDDAYIGTGAIFKQGKPGKPLRVGKGAIVGAGAVVTKNVPPGTTVFGNPAMPLTPENLEIQRRHAKP